jgi:hypothetical protein
MNTQAQEPYEFPPIVPDGEAVTEEPSVTATCSEQVREFTKHWQLGQPLLTRSDKWGLVWRVDFTMPGESLAPLINRIICWQEPGGGVVITVAIGQPVPPLHTRWHSGAEPETLCRRHDGRFDQRDDRSCAPGARAWAYIQRMTIKRDEIIGKPVGEQPEGEAEHFIQCPACNGWIDCRDLGHVLEHEGPLPHPGQDQTN